MLARFLFMAYIVAVSALVVAYISLDTPLPRHLTSFFLSTALCAMLEVA